MRRILIAATLALVSCERSDDEETLPVGPCEEEIALRAYAEPGPTSTGTRVYGETLAPNGVTVRAVYVAGQLVPLASFNYRGFQVDVQQDVLEAVAVDGTAALTVVAYTSTGCDDLAEDERPRIAIATGGRSGSGGNGGRDDSGGVGGTGGAGGS